MNKNEIAWLSILVIFAVGMLFVARQQNHKADLVEFGEAVELGDVKLVQKFLDSGLDPTKDSDADAWLASAASSGRLELTRLLVEAGIDPSKEDDWGVTPLYASIGYDSPEVFFYFVDVVGWDALDLTGPYTWQSFPTYRAGSRSPLSPAIHARHGQILEALIERGVRLDVPDETGLYPLEQYNANTTVARLLIGAGANPNHHAKGEASALMWAADEGDLDKVQLFLENGADISYQDRDGNSALSFAFQRGHDEITTLLIDHGAKADAE